MGASTPATDESVEDHVARDIGPRQGSALADLHSVGDLEQGSGDELVRVHGLRLDVIARFGPERADCPVIHRDELLVF